MSSSSSWFKIELITTTSIYGVDNARVTQARSADTNSPDRKVEGCVTNETIGARRADMIIPVLRTSAILRNTGTPDLTVGAIATRPVGPRRYETLDDEEIEANVVCRVSGASRSTAYADGTDPLSLRAGRNVSELSLTVGPLPMISVDPSRPTGV